MPAVAMLRYAEGANDESRAAIERLQQHPGIEPANQLALIYAFEDDADEAFHWLSQAADRISRSELTEQSLTDYRHGVHLTVSPPPAR